MKKCRLKKKRKISLFKITLLLVLIFFMFSSIKIIINYYKNESKKNLLSLFLFDSNHHFDLKIDENVIDKISNYIFPIYNNKEEYAFNDEIDDVFIDEESTVKTEYVYDPNNSKIQDPIVYIYNTHQLENYTGDLVLNINPNVLLASYFLKEKLNKIGVKTIVETSNITEFLNINNLGYASSYEASRYFLKNALDEYKSLKLIIDLHRDAVSKDKTTITIDGTSYAKVLFVVGKEHDNYNENLEFAKKLNSLIKEKYKDLSRGIITKSGNTVNGIYNQDLNNKIVLIELGGEENNFDEIINTINIISPIIKEFIGA